MSMSFIYYNYCDLDSTTITASTENAFFPASNLKDPRSTKVFRSTASSASVVFDFGSPVAIDVFACVPHFANGFGFIGSLTLEANATNTWGSPAFTTTITSGADIDTTFQVAYKEFTEQTYRYWRVSGSGASYLELSRVYLGKNNNILGRSISYGWNYTSNDNSKVTKNLYGQRFSDQINRQKEFNFDFKNLTKDEVDEWFKVYDYNGITKPFFMRIGCDGILNDIDRFSGEVYLDKIPSITNSFYARYDVSVNCIEAL
jgi:hypothetical protein